MRALENLTFAAEAIRLRELSSAELIEACLDRYAATVPTLRAVAWLDPDRARRIARLTGLTHAQVNRELNRLASLDRITEATVEQLERRLATRLFERSRRSVALTPAGGCRLARICSIS